MFLYNVLYLGWSLLLNLSPYPVIGAALFYLVTLMLTRRAATPTVPALFLLSSMCLVLLGSIYAGEAPHASTHAVTMLLPALAVYLGGARLGLFIALLLVVALALGFPAYMALTGTSLPPLSPSKVWLAHFFAGIAFLGAWGLGSLHNTARDAAQSSLERTLRELRDGERKLLSLIESTDDPVVSMDIEGRVLTANSSARQLYRKRQGMELELGKPFFGPREPARFGPRAPYMTQVLQGQRVRFEEHGQDDSRSLMDVSINPIFGEGGQVVGMTFFGRDITARREAEIRLEEMHRTLVDVSRQAGMAEVATGVLHNVGNILNSVNISTSLVTEGLRKSRVTGMAKATTLLREHAADLAPFLTQDPRGQKLPDYLGALTDQLQAERDALLQEMLALTESVEHIKAIVSMQQKYARTAGTVEQVMVPQLIDEALRLHAVSFERHGIFIDRDYAQVPSLFVDRHKFLQILINLLSNAQHALEESQRPDKRLSIRLQQTTDGGGLLVDVADNGVGIAPENLPRLFTQGFTTKRTGHGFGLHFSALTASELGGRLTCTSPGVGEGATFTLELPLIGAGPSE
jgi:PAS domain S-box-containing protein